MICALSPTRLVRAFFGVAVLALILGGCVGGQTYSLDRGRLAEDHLPTEREVGAHPDSLRTLAITKEDGKYKFEFKDGDYQSLHRKWSSTFQVSGTGRRPQRPLSYATFWGLDLSLASLPPELGINTLSEDRATKLLKSRKKEYFSTIQIDVYWFEEEGESDLTGPSARIELRIGDNRYQPAKEENTPLREAFLDGGRTAYYRRNTFYFSRIDSTDILDQAHRIELYVDPLGGSSEAQFAWEWDSTKQAAARPWKERQGTMTGELPGMLQNPSVLVGAGNVGACRSRRIFRHRPNKRPSDDCRGFFPPLGPLRDPMPPGQ